MSIILIIAVIWGVSALARAAKEAKRQREAERQRREAAARSAELARMTAEWKQRQAEAKIETARLIALEREAMRQREVERKQAEWNARQEEINRKHDEQIAKLEFRLSTAESDIAHWNEQIAALYAILDMEQLELAGTVNGSKEQMKHQKKIITLNNQIHAAENRLNKAKFEKSFCEDKLAS